MLNQTNTADVASQPTKTQYKLPRTTLTRAKSVLALKVSIEARRPL